MVTFPTGTNPVTEIASLILSNLQFTIEILSDNTLSEVSPWIYNPLPDTVVLVNSESNILILELSDISIAFSFSFIPVNLQSMNSIFLDLLI